VFRCSGIVLVLVLVVVLGGSGDQGSSSNLDSSAVGAFLVGGA
jgi:hypothetical protein